jgi:O-antigen/teichoic acid export membrane protein
MPSLDSLQQEDHALSSAQQQPSGSVDPVVRTAGTDSVREATLAGVKWSGLARLIIETLSFLSSVALARLVAPIDFGHAAAAIGIIAVGLGLSTEGFGTPLVQRKEVTRAHIEACFLMSMATGALLSSFFFLLAPLGTPLFGHETASLIQLASPAFFLVSLGVVPQALQQRRLNFRIISLIEMAALVSAVFTSVVLALLGLGAQALVLGQMAIPFTAVVLNLLAAPSMRPKWHRAEAREIVGFGTQTTLASLPFSIYANVDYAIVNVKLGARATGFYWRAYQIGGVYQGKITQIMLRVALPVYSRTEDAGDMRDLRRRIVRVHASVIFPLLAIYVVVAPKLLPLVFGDRWSPAIVPSQILAAAGMVGALGGGSGAFLIAAGRPRIVLISNLLMVLLYVGVVAAFAPYGLTILCTAIAFVVWTQYLAMYYVVFDRMLGVPMSQLWHEAGPALISLIPVFGVGVPLFYLLTVAHVAPVVQVIITGSVSAAAYALCLRVFFRRVWRDLALLAQRMLGGSGRPLRRFMRRPVQE